MHMQFLKVAMKERANVGGGTQKTKEMQVQQRAEIELVGNEMLQ